MKIPLTFGGGIFLRHCWRCHSSCMLGHNEHYEAQRSQRLVYFVPARMNPRLNDLRQGRRSDGYPLCTSCPPG